VNKRIGVNVNWTHLVVNLGFNLILCYYALGDEDKLKRGFVQLLSVPEFFEFEESELQQTGTTSVSPSTEKDESKRELMKRYMTVHLFNFPFLCRLNKLQ
jgi:hypothetical protein